MFVLGWPRDNGDGAGDGWSTSRGRHYHPGGRLAARPVQYITVQYSSVEYSTVQYSTVPYSTMK